MFSSQLFIFMSYEDYFQGIFQGCLPGLPQETNLLVESPRLPSINWDSPTTRPLRVPAKSACSKGRCATDGGLAQLYRLQDFKVPTSLKADIKSDWTPGVFSSVFRCLGLFWDVVCIEPLGNNPITILCTVDVCGEIRPFDVTGWSGIVTVLCHSSL